MDPQDLIFLIRTLTEENEQLREETTRLNSDNERLRESCETLRNAGERLRESSPRSGDALGCANGLSQDLEGEIKALRKSIDSLIDRIEAAVVLFKARSDVDFGRKSEVDA